MNFDIKNGATPRFFILMVGAWLAIHEPIFISFN